MSSAVQPAGFGKSVMFSSHVQYRQFEYALSCFEDSPPMKCHHSTDMLPVVSYFH